MIIELCKKLIFNRTTKRYMHNPESILENETYKDRCDFEIQTNPLFSTRQPDLVIVNNKKKQNWETMNCWYVHRPCKNTKKKMEHIGDGDTHCNWSTNDW